MSLPDEELLSAYLDGQLSADERSRVERLLAESPESRQLLEELRSIQTSLQRMPRARLGHEFADHVLRQAEKEVLNATADGDGNSADSGGEKRPVVLPSERTDIADLGRISWQRLRRPVIWASLTLAAGLLIMFLDRDDGPRAGRKIAMAPGDVKQRENEWGARSDPAGVEAAAGNDDGAEFRAPAAPALHDSLERQSATPKEPASRTDRYGESESMPSGAAPPPAAMPPAPPPSAVAGDRAGSVGKPAKAESDRKMSRPLDEPGESDADARLRLLATDNNTLVVWCDVAPGTNYSESFRELLAEQDIRWEGEAEVAEQEALLGLEAKAKTPEEMSARKKKAPQTGLQLGEEARQKRLADTEQAVLDSTDEVVLVEADQPRIEAVLAGIDVAANVFVNVAVEPAPDAPEQQQQLGRFARGNVSQKKVDQLQERGDESAKQLKKREEAPLARTSKPAGGEANQTQSAAAGVARRLAVRLAPPSDETVKDEAPKEKAELAQSQARRERDARMKKSNQTFSFGLGAAGQQAADKDRVQVLFVLHPMEANSTPADAKPSDRDE